VLTNKTMTHAPGAGHMVTPWPPETGGGVKAVVKDGSPSCSVFLMQLWVSG